MKGKKQYQKPKGVEKTIKNNIKRTIQLIVGLMIITAVTEATGTVFFGVNFYPLIFLIILGIIIASNFIK